MAGLHSGVNPVSGDFSVGVEGLMVKGGELAEPIREATIASTAPAPAARHLGRRRRPRVAARRHRRRHPGHPRHRPVRHLARSVPILHAIVLGITQGLSEFLPISSSGHLILVPWLFGWDDFAGNASLEKTFDVALHLGTLVGAVAYFRADIAAVPAGRVHARAGAAPTTGGSPGCSWRRPCRPPSPARCSPTSSRSTPARSR